MSRETHSTPALDSHPAGPRSPSLPIGLARSLTSILGPLIGVIVVVAIFGIWKPDSFLTFRTLDNFLLYNSYYAVAAMGMTFVIITAGIDLSVGSTMALSSICCALASRGGAFPPPRAAATIPIGVGVALFAGAFLCPPPNHG